MIRKVFSLPRFDTLASLRLAVITMSALGISCIVATFYEMKYGTEAAQRDFYRTWWFTLILITLGLNIFFSMMKRYPWKSHHAGFVIAHVGILTLLVGSLISLHFGLDSNMALFEGETTDRVSVLEKALQVALPDGANGSFPVVLEKYPPSPGHEQRFRIPGSDVALVAEEFAPHVEVQDNFREGNALNPALHFVLKAPFATQEGWLIAADAERNHVNFGPVSVSFALAGSEAEAQQILGRPAGESHVSFVRLPDGQLRYGVSGPQGPGASGPVELGKPVATPLGGMALSADRLLERAVSERTVVPATPPANEQRRMPAVKVHLEGPQGRTPSDWLLWTESRNVGFGNGFATVAYRSPELQVPFRVTLLKFNSDKYPGSSMAATYESWVRVDDAERGVSEEHHISMNHPLHYRGYIFFQSSFVEGTPMMSIFSVARAPGLPLVYVGVTLIGAGIGWMFYIKPYLVKRQAARALAARRLEGADEAKRTDPVPAGPAAEPASGRA